MRLSNETFSANNFSYLSFNSTTPHISYYKLIEKQEFKILFGVLMGALCLVTTFGNISVIYKYRKASMVGNLFIISLAIADLIVGVFVMPIATIYAITEDWTMSLPLCLVWLSADYTASTASILNLFTLSLDRYWSITSPLKYLGKRTRSRAMIMIALAWSISLLWLIPITSWSYIFNKGVRYVPENKCDTEYNKNIPFKIATAICNFYLPLLAMILLNTKIYIVIRRRYHNPIMKYSCNTSQYNRSLESNSQVSSNNQNEFFYHEVKENRRNHVIKKRAGSFSLDANNYFTAKNEAKALAQVKELRHSNSTKSKCSFLSHLFSMFKLSDQRAEKIPSNMLQGEEQVAPNNIKNDFSSIYNDKMPANEANKTLVSTPTPTNSTPSNSLNLINSNSIRGNRKQCRRGFLNKQEKAFKQLAAIVIGFTLCFLPYFIVFLIVAICEDCVSNMIFTFTVWLGYLNSAINPFLYALSNKRLNKSKSTKQLQQVENKSAQSHQRSAHNHNNKNVYNMRHVKIKRQIVANQKLTEN